MSDNFSRRIAEAEAQRDSLLSKMMSYGRAHPDSGRIMKSVVALDSLIEGLRDRRAAQEDGLPSPDPLPETPVADVERLIQEAAQKLISAGAVPRKKRVKVTGWDRNGRITDLESYEDP
jgi:hypothetical protein